MMFLCSDKKGWGSQTLLSPSEVQVLAKRRQISTDGSLRARSPDSPAVIAEGARLPGDPTGPQGPQVSWTAGTRSHRLRPMQTAMAIKSQRGEIHRRLKTWWAAKWAALPTVPEPSRTQSQLVPCAPQFSCWLRPGEIESPRERATSYLILHLRTNTSLKVDWIAPLMVAHLQPLSWGAGLTVAPTNG